MDITQYKLNKVPDNQRMNFFPSIASNYMGLENTLFNQADNQIKQYNGGYWEFVEISWNNKVLRFAKVPVKGRFNLACEGRQCHVEVDAVSAGIALMMMSLSHMSFVAKGNDQENIIQAYYDFKEFLGATSFPDRNSISSYLD